MLFFQRRRWACLLLVMVFGASCADAAFVDEESLGYGKAVQGLGPKEATLVKHFSSTSTPESSNPAHFVRIGDNFAFAASDPVHGRELWKSDGTVAGTVLVKDITPGIGSSSPENLTVVDDTLFFTVTRGSKAPELWKSDGTDAGTVRVWAGYGIEGASAITELTDVEGVLYFVAIDEAGVRKLWKSDGTTTTEIRSTTFAQLNLSTPAYLTNVNGTLFFSAESKFASSTSGHELWKTDGTNEGTVLVKDILAGSGSSSPKSLLDVGGTLYFTAVGWSDGQRGLWRTDGTPEGTVLVKQIPGHWSSDESTAVDGTIYFGAPDGSNNNGLWKSDGTPSGTMLVKANSSNSGSFSPANLTPVGDTLYFTAFASASGTELWKSDGTDVGTVLVKDVSPGKHSSSPTALTNVDGTLYFISRDASGAAKLWKSNGTASGTVSVSEVQPWFSAAAPRPFTHLDGSVYFAADEGNVGVELWKSDGTAASTRLLIDIASGNVSLSPKHLTPFNGALYFSAFSTDHGTELWKSNGTPGGTTIVRDVFAGPGSSSPENLTVSGNALFFTADDGVNGTELWKTNGTQAGTVLVSDIRPGPGSSSPSELVDVDGTLFFTADDGINGRELWKSDGTAAGTRLVKDIVSGGASSSPEELTAMNGKLYFTAFSGGERQLWTSDGTAAGTTRINDIYTNSTDPRELTVVGGLLYFTATDSTNGRQLRRSNGTPEETVLLKKTGTGSGVSVPTLLTAVGDTLYFRLDRNKLWKSDGSSAGTTLVATIGSNATRTSLWDLTAVNDMLYFVGDDGVIGKALWKSNATSEGTKVVKDIAGEGNDFVTSLAAVGDFLAFAAFHPATGLELWSSTGSEANTGLVHDLVPGAPSSSPSDFVRVHSQMFFVATDESARRGLFVIDTAEDPIASEMVCPNVGEEATSPDGAIVTFSPYVVDDPFAIVTTTPASGSLFPLGITNVEAVAEGGDASCSFTVTVRDTTPPTIACPSDVVAEASDANGAYVTFEQATAFDAVSSATVTHAPASGSRFRLGSTMVTARATDDAGNWAECTFNVTVRDTVKPEMSCPDRIVVEATSRTGARVRDYGVTATDAVSTPSLAYSHPPNSTFALGETPVTATATDAAGNTASCTFPVIVQDTTPPSMNCPDLFQVEATSAQGALIGSIGVHAQDAVSTPTMSYSPGLEDFFPLGQTTVTATATDDAGNSTSCSINVIVADTTPPDVSCPTNQSQEATSESGTPVFWPPASATDAVSTPTITYDKAPGSLFDLGRTKVTVTATDDAGNVASCAFDVHVSDTWAPVITCPESVAAEATSSAGALVSYPPATATDNASTPTISYTHPSGGTFPVGATKVTATAKDASNNTAHCTFTVVVRDTTPPVISCPASLVAEATSRDGALVTYPEAVATDTASIPEIIYSHESGKRFALGTTRVTALASDKARNTAACTFTVTVVDTTAPDISCPESAFAEATKAAGARVVFPKATASDAVSTPSIEYDREPGDLFALGTTTVTATATDDAGNASSCSFAVTVADTTPPTITCPDDISLVETDKIGTVASYPPAVASDAVSSPTVTYTHQSGRRFQVGETTVTATATDAAGNFASCSFTVTIIARDWTPPTIVCEVDRLFVEATGPDGARVTYPPATATDDKSTPTVTYDHENERVFPLGETVVTATATDAAGNFASCSFTVAVDDTTPPALRCPRDFLVQTSDEAGTVVSFEMATAEDLVSTPTVVYDHPTNEKFPVGTTSVKVTATDEVDNQAECSFDVQVIFVSEEDIPEELEPPDRTGPIFDEDEFEDGGERGSARRAPMLVGGCDCSGASAPGSAFLIGLATLLSRRRRVA